MRCHPDKLEELERKEKEAENKKGTPVIAKLQQTSLAGFYKSDKLTITMTRDVFIDGIVKLVAFEGLAIRFFSTQSFQQVRYWNFGRY